MRILYIAEIVGKPGLYTVKTLLPRLRKEKKIDFVIANGDAVTGGFGIGKNHSIYLRKLGVDVITGGDMTFFKKDMAEHIEKAHYLLRPANLPPEMPGRGWRHYTVKPVEWETGSGDVNTDSADGETTSSPGAGRDATDGASAVTDPSAAEPATSASLAAESQSTATTAEASSDDRPTSPAPDVAPVNHLPDVRIAVLSLIGQSGFDRTHGSNPYTYLNNVLERLSKNSSVVIVDFHALTTAEKYTMFHHADGKVTAVLGSGQRVQTADAQVFPSGTAVICDAGRTGSQTSVSGLAPGPEIKKYLTRIPVRSEESWDGLELQGAILEVDLASGYVVGFESLRESCPAPPPEERQARERSRRDGKRSNGSSDGRSKDGKRKNGKGADERSKSNRRGDGASKHGAKEGDDRPGAQPSGAPTAHE